MKKMVIVLLCAVLIFSVVGCGSNPLAGKWVYSDNAMEAFNSIDDLSSLSEMELEFKSNGKLIVSDASGVKGEVKYTIEGDQVTIYTEDGTSGDQLTLDGDNLKLDDTIIYTRK